jgi:hypothetical protein
MTNIHNTSNNKTNFNIMNFNFYKTSPKNDQNAINLQESNEVKS